MIIWLLFWNWNLAKWDFLDVISADPEINEIDKLLENSEEEGEFEDDFIALAGGPMPEESTRYKNENDKKNLNLRGGAKVSWLWTKYSIFWDIRETFWIFCFEYLFLEYKSGNFWKKIFPFKTFFETFHYFLYILLGLSCLFWYYISKF